MGRGPVAIGTNARAEGEPHIHLVGAVPRSQVVPHFEWADVFFMPSVCEGSATVTYEALMSGLPVIATPNPGSVVIDGVNGFTLRRYGIRRPWWIGFADCRKTPRCWREWNWLLAPATVEFRCKLTRSDCYGRYASQTTIPERLTQHFNAMTNKCTLQFQIVSPALNARADNPGYNAIGIPVFAG